MEKIITGGVYVVVDPGMEARKILKKLAAIRDEPLAAVQIWDNPKTAGADKELIGQIAEVFEGTRVPVLINNRIELIDELKLDGVHFDEIPHNLSDELRGMDSLFKGVTLTNDLSVISMAEEFGFNYTSFCSMFPSQTSDSCEIVSHETVNKCRQLTNMPLFLSGGITPERMELLKDLPVNGVAVVSAIMNADDPLRVVKEYDSLLRKHQIISTDEVGYY